MNKNKQTFDLVLTAFFLALLILFASIPMLGFIPLGPINATTLHIPVIIGAIVLGPKKGAFLGACFGLISMLRSTFLPTPLSFVFSPFIPVIGTDSGSLKALIIAFIPRILIGVVAYYTYVFLTKLFKGKAKQVSLFLAGIAGSLTNTILVMNGIYFLFQKDYAQVIGKSGKAVFQAVNTVIFTQGVPEAIVAGILTMAVCSVLLPFVHKKQKKNS